MLMTKNPQKTSADARVEVHLELTPEGLARSVADFACGRRVAHIFKGALKADIAFAAARMLDEIGTEPYDGADAVGRYGLSLFETGNSPERQVDYYRNQKSNLKRLRALFPEGAFPVDQMRIMLADEWKMGTVARLLTESGLTNLGICRFLDTSGAIYIHNDAAAADVPTSLIVQQIDIQITCNWYLCMPENGGEVFIYPKRVSRLEYDANRRPAPHSYALQDEFLADVEPVVIKPEATDLVLWDATYPHAVSACHGDRPRATLSCFIGVTRNRDLRFFS